MFSPFNGQTYWTERNTFNNYHYDHNFRNSHITEIDAKLSARITTDRNLEIAPKPAPLQKNNADHFAELKENQKPQPGGPDFNLSNC